MRITKQLIDFMKGFSNPRDMDVLTRVEYGKRTYWLEMPGNVPNGAQRLGAFSDVKAAIAKAGR